jgi:hypothetical protein
MPSASVRPSRAARAAAGSASVGTSVQLTQPDCSVASFDLTKRPASAYRSELLIITHQPNNGPHDMPGPVACSQAEAVAQGLREDVVRAGGH